MFKYPQQKLIIHRSIKLFFGNLDFEGASWSHYNSTELHVGAPFWIWLLPSSTCFFTSWYSLIVNLIFAMQYNISLSIYRILGHLIFQLHREFFDTPGTIPIMVYFWQLILLSSCLFCDADWIVCQFASIRQWIFYHSWRLACFLEVEKTGLHFLILGKWASLHEKSRGWIDMAQSTSWYGISTGAPDLWFI